MKKIVNLLVVVACLGVLVNFGAYHSATNEPIQTCGILEEDVFTD